MDEGVTHARTHCSRVNQYHTTHDHDYGFREEYEEELCIPFHHHAELLLMSIGVEPLEKVLLL